MPEDEWLDVVAAAERHGCSTKTIWRRVWEGGLPSRSEKVSGRDGRPVIKTLIRVSDLDYAFGSAGHDEHVRKILEAAPPLTLEQVSVIGEVLQNHLRDRDAERRSPGGSWIIGVGQAAPSRIRSASEPSSGHWPCG